MSSNASSNNYSKLESFKNTFRKRIHNKMLPKDSNMQGLLDDGFPLNSNKKMALSEKDISKFFFLDGKNFFENAQKAGITELHLRNPHFINLLNNISSAEISSRIQEDVFSKFKKFSLKTISESETSLVTTPSCLNNSNRSPRLSNSQLLLTGDQTSKSSRVFQLTTPTTAVSCDPEGNFTKLIDNIPFSGSNKVSVDKVLWKKQIKDLSKKQESKIIAEPSSAEFREQLDLLIRKKMEMIQYYKNSTYSLKQWIDQQRERFLNENSIAMLECLMMLLDKDCENEINAVEKLENFSDWLLNVRLREISLYISKLNSNKQSVKISDLQSELNSDIGFLMSQYEKANTALQIDYHDYNTYLSNTGKMMLLNTCFQYKDNSDEMIESCLNVFHYNFKSLLSAYPDLMEMKKIKFQEHKVSGRPNLIDLYENLEKELLIKPESLIDDKELHILEDKNDTVVENLEIQTNCDNVHVKQVTQPKVNKLDSEQEMNDAKLAEETKSGKNKGSKRKLYKPRANSEFVEDSTFFDLIKAPEILSGSTNQEENTVLETPVFLKNHNNGTDVDLQPILSRNSSDNKSKMINNQNIDKNFISIKEKKNSKSWTNTLKNLTTNGPNRETNKTEKLHKTVQENVDQIDLNSNHSSLDQQSILKPSKSETNTLLQDMSFKGFAGVLDQILNPWQKEEEENSKVISRHI